MHCSTNRPVAQCYTSGCNAVGCQIKPIWWSITLRCQWFTWYTLSCLWGCQIKPIWRSITLSSSGSRGIHYHVCGVVRSNPRGGRSHSVIHVVYTILSVGLSDQTHLVVDHTHFQCVTLYILSYLWNGFDRE